MLNQLTNKTSLDKIVTKTDLSYWHIIAFFFKKIISIKT